MGKQGQVRDPITGTYAEQPQTSGNFTVANENAAIYKNWVSSEAFQLSNTARGILKEAFNDNERFSLPVGHPVVALTEAQLYQTLRTLCGETVSASFDLLNSLAVETLGKSGTYSSKNHERTKGFRRPLTPANSRSGSTMGDDQSVAGQTETDGGTSGALHTSDESGNEGFVRETIPTNEAGFLVTSPRAGPSSASIQPAQSVSPAISSSSSQPLAAIKEKIAVQELPVVPEDGLAHETDFDSPGKKTSKRRKTQMPQILKSTYSKGMTWTRTFVCGPMDPLENRYSFYCLICQMNLSCKSKGAQEVLRHHRTEKHLRKDQRWRYEHLRTTDPVSGRTRYEVRDRHGRVLEPYELERELPNFIDVELVEVGPKLPFVDEVESGICRPSTDEETRHQVQMSLVGTFLVTSGDSSALEGLWSNVGVFANRQEMFADFEWGKDHILTMLHQFSLCIIRDIGHHIGLKGIYSLEFEKGVPFSRLFIRFWKNDSLVRVLLCRFSRASGYPNGHLGCIAEIVSALSTKPDIVSCSGCPGGILDILTKAKFFPKGIQSPLCFNTISLRKLFHKSMPSVFGPVDFYSVLQYLIVYLGAADQEDWILDAPALLEVSLFLSFTAPISFSVLLFLIFFSECFRQHFD